jgi:hypothetical protein
MPGIVSILHLLDTGASQRAVLEMTGRKPDTRFNAQIALVISHQSGSRIGRR